MKTLPRAAVCLGAGGAILAGMPSMLSFAEGDTSAINTEVERCAANLSESPQEVDVLPEACKTLENSFTVKTETASLRSYTSVSILSNVIKYELPNASTFRDDYLITPELKDRQQRDRREFGYIVGGMCIVTLFGMDSFAEYTRSRRLSAMQQTSVV